MKLHTDGFDTFYVPRSLQENHSETVKNYAHDESWDEKPKVDDCDDYEDSDEL